MYYNLKNVYISGPMSGYKNFNYDRFDAEAMRLRMLGYTVYNPAETTVEADKEWSDYMREAIVKLMSADFVVLLEGWEKSRGACIEKQLAEQLNIKCYLYTEINECYYKHYDYLETLFNEDNEIDRRQFWLNNVINYFNNHNVDMETRKRLFLQYSVKELNEDIIKIVKKAKKNKNNYYKPIDF